MACPTTCKLPTPAQAHCATCHRTFGGVTGFDAHRKDGACVDPATLGYVERGGVWRSPMTAAARARFAQAAREPDCCRCDPAKCREDDTGQHCEDQSCGSCLHGCPAPVGVRCCRERA